MGADNIYLTIKGGNPDYVRRKFKAKQKDDAIEYGSGSYQGNWSNVDDIQFTDKIFKTSNEAYKYLFEHCKKWDDGLVVQARDDKGSLFWLLGACVAI